MTESLILCIEQCMLFRIALPNGEYKRNAGEWQQSDFLSSGKLLIFRDSTGFFIRIIDENENELCRVINLKTNVEPVNDSSRYYILHIIENKGSRNAIIGLGFTDRQSAFDFTASLQEIERRNDNREKTKETHENNGDYVLRGNETISLPYDIPQSGNETFGELPPFDESKVPAIAFNEQQMQQMDIDSETLKREFETEIYEIEAEEYRKKMVEYQQNRRYNDDSDSDSEEEKVKPPQKPSSMIEMVLRMKPVSISIAFVTEDIQLP